MKKEAKKEKWEQSIHEPISMDQRLINIVRFIWLNLIRIIIMLVCLIAFCMLLHKVNKFVEANEKREKQEIQEMRKIISGEVQEIQLDGKNELITFSNGKTIAFRVSNKILQKGKINTIFYKAWLHTNTIDSIRVK